jgi:hypothetical protein
MHHLATRRLLPTAAGALLLAATLTACGGGPGGDAPDNASNEDFCNAFNDAPGDGADADAVHDYADRLADVGTPSDITGDAREGFEIFVDYAADVSDDDISKFDDSADPSDIFDGDDASKVSAFVSKYAEICITSQLEGLPTDVPTDGLEGLPTDIPTDGLESLLPTDVPS